MNVILLSGGSGLRLWPLSNEARSKQFIKLLNNENGQYESMLQRVHAQIMRTSPDAEVTFATGKSQVSSILNQVGEAVNICVEPAKKDTFPAIVLATLYLRDVKGVSEDDAVVVCPVDPYTDDAFFEVLKRMYDTALKGLCNICLMGGVPTYPSAKYGYIIPRDDGEISDVDGFFEKPDEKTAEEYIKQGGLWNLGVFAFKIAEVAKYADGKSYEEYLSVYEDAEAISFDYAVCEHEKNMKVLRYDGEWKDIGTWNTFSEVMTDDAIGNVITDEYCSNLTVVNELDIPVIAMGIDNAVIAAAPDGILIADKARSSHMKPYVDALPEKGRAREQVSRREKKTIKIKFTDWWKRYKFEKSILYTILNKHYDVVICDDADYVLCSVYGKEHQKSDAIVIGYSGEDCSASMMYCDYIIDFDDYEYLDRHYCLPNYFFEYDRIAAVDKMRNKHLIADEAIASKYGFCSFVSSHATDMRLAFLNELSSYKEVDCGGRVGHNTDINDGVEAVLDFEKSHKFSMAFEHHSRSDYITEKLVQSFAACTVPIYWGADNVTKYFNPEAMVIVDENDIPAAIERIKQIDNDDDLYRHMLRQPAIAPGMEEWFDNALPGLEAFLCNIFDQDIEKARRRGSTVPDNYRSLPQLVLDSQRNSIEEWLSKDRLLQRLILKRVFRKNRWRGGAEKNNNGGKGK